MSALLIQTTSQTHSEALRALQEAGLPEQLSELESAPFALSAITAQCLEALLTASSLGLGASDGLAGLIIEQGQREPSFFPPELTPQQQQLCGALQLIVMTDAYLRRAEGIGARPQVEGPMALDGLPELLETAPPAALVQRVLRLIQAFIKMNAPASKPSAGPPAKPPASAIAACLELLRSAALEYIEHGRLRPLVRALKGAKVHADGYSYDGLRFQAPQASGLLPLLPQDIVGNEDYLQAGLRLARDVAGFDLQEGRNPKQLNPILFGLGRPGCGKTVTAHAIGNYFLEHCGARDVPAKFLVVRRTDWASSYQNASALNLVRLFKEDVASFNGVVGVYWPDIDTAFASRDSSQLRMEEKQNLSAVFGVFDGTLLPKDGRWFLICDANTMRMDQAAISRISQNPMMVAGPTSAAQYVQLLQEVLLKDLHPFLPQEPEVWQEIGARAKKHDLSGRNIQAIAGNIRAHIQDFEFPEAYFKASSQDRKKLVADLCKPIDAKALHHQLDRWIDFQQSAEQRSEEQRFELEVESIVRRLNAAKTAERLFEPSGSHSPAV